MEQERDAKSVKSTAELVVELRDLLCQFLDQHKNITVHGLSKKCGVASSTLRRIVMGETKEEPRPSTVLGIVVAVTKETNIQKLIERFPGAIGDALKRSYVNLLSEQKSAIDLNDVLVDPVAYIVYKMAANSSGVRLKNLIKMLGMPAQDTVSELKELGLLYEEAGRIHAVNKSFSLQPYVYKRHIGELVRFTKFGSQYVDGSLFVNYSESISPEAYYKIKDIVTTAVKEVKGILSKRENFGEVPFFLTTILDTMEVFIDEDEQNEDH